MGAGEPVQHPDNVVHEAADDDATALQEGRGSLFRAAVGCGGALFLVVLGFGLYQGVDPGVAFFRALGALLALAVCGWLAERVTHLPPPAASPPAHAPPPAE